MELEKVCKTVIVYIQKMASAKTLGSTLTAGGHLSAQAGLKGVADPLAGRGEAPARTEWRRMRMISVGQGA